VDGRARMLLNGLRRSVYSVGGILLILAATLFSCPAEASAQGVFRLALMQSQRHAETRFRPLQDYLRRNGVEVEIVLTEDYPDAARMFAAGEVDGMFSGSAVAGAMILKGTAYPLLRPLSRSGESEYWAVILARRGTARYSPSADYFRGKRVASCALASAGELYLRSIPGAAQGVRSLLLTATHQAALVALAKGEVEVAIVKNLVWENLQTQYPALEAVGQDAGRNPNNTLIVSRRADPKVVERLTALLLGLGSDPGREAGLARAALNIQGYIPTSVDDFDHTLRLLAAAGIGANYDFRNYPSPPGPSTDHFSPDLPNYP